MAAPRLAVIGAGVFGGWTALELQRRGAAVTLVDAWGPGHVRASSGGETRVIRAGYGSHEIYTEMTARALRLWRAYDERHRTRWLRPTGVLWLIGADEAFARASAAALRDQGLPIEELTRAETQRRFPQIGLSDVSSAIFERDAGYLFARQACEHIVEVFVAAGGSYRHAAAAAPCSVDSLASGRASLCDGTSIAADAFVFACGPWLGHVFPDVLAGAISVTRQEVFYFGTPAGDGRFEDATCPVWLDLGPRIVYGIPGNAHRGFKVADDTPGPPVDPTTIDRTPTADGAAAARAYVARRFPALADAPIVGAEVCQYESTADANFILDRHPAAPNVWIAGGGSGHGFKMGPVVGEMLASHVLGESEPAPLFRLARFHRPPDGGWKAKWG